MSVAHKARRLPRREDCPPLTIQVDGEAVQAFAGESVAGVLLALGRQSFRHSERYHSPRGMFCGMGVCFDCLVTVDGVANVRACMTLVRAGMIVETGRLSRD